MAWKRPEWFRWEREAAIRPLLFFLEGSTLPCKAFFGRGWPDTYLIFNGKVVLWLNRMQGLCDLGQTLIDRLLDPKELRHMEKRLGSDTRRLESHYPRLAPEALRPLSDSELLAAENAFWRDYGEWSVTGLSVEPVYLQSEVLLRKMLEGTDKAEAKLSALTACTRKSFSVQQECKLLQIAAEEGLNANNFGKALSGNARLKEKLERHAAKYFWLQNGYLHTEALPAAHFAGELGALLREKDAAAYLREIEDGYATRLRERGDLMDSLRLDEEKRRLVGLIDYFGWFQDYRKEVILQASHRLDSLLSEVARRGSISLEEAKYALPAEIPLLLGKKMVRDRIRARMRHCLIVMKEDSAALEILEGEAAHALEKKLLPAAGLGKVALYDLNGTLASDMRGSGMEKYAKALKDQLAVINNMTDEKIIAAFEKRGIKLGGKNLGKAVAEAAWELAREPPRGTKAREAYYDLMELWVRRGEAGVSVFPEVWEKGNAIERDRKSGLEVVALSRGIQKLLDVILEVSKLDSVVERIYSTIPYGAEKTAKCYYLFMQDLAKEKKIVAKAYEDEIENVEGLLAADVALAIKLEMKEIPYEVIWVDRSGEHQTKEGKEKLREFEGVYARFRKDGGWKKGFNEVLSVVRSLG